MKVRQYAAKDAWAGSGAVGRVLCPGVAGEQHPATQGPSLGICSLTGSAFASGLAAVLKRWAYLLWYEPDR